MSFEIEPRLEPVQKEKPTNWGAVIGGFAVALVVTFLIMSYGKSPDTAGMQPTNAQSSSTATAPTAPPETTGSAPRSQ